MLTYSCQLSIRHQICPLRPLAGGEGEFCRRMCEYRSSKGAGEISDRSVLAQALDIGGAQAEPIAKDLRRVLAEQRGGFEFWRLPIKAHRPGRHLEGAGRMIRNLQNAALG